MPKFSQTSKSRLADCHPTLQRLFNTVVETFDCTIVCGHRSEYEQNKAFFEGNSKLKYPKSKHNIKPSLAVDAAPYISGKGISWDANQCRYFAGYVMGVASRIGIKLRWGGDWDSDNDVNDQSFNDLVHFELEE